MKKLKQVNVKDLKIGDKLFGRFLITNIDFAESGSYATIQQEDLEDNNRKSEMLYTTQESILIEDLTVGD